MFEKKKSAAAISTIIKQIKKYIYNIMSDLMVLCSMISIMFLIYIYVR